jgi:hypothetical protein
MTSIAGEDAHGRKGTQEQQSEDKEGSTRARNNLKRRREADEGEMIMRGGLDSLERLGRGDVLTLFLALQAEMKIIIDQRRRRAEEERRKSLEIAEAHPISFLSEAERLSVLRDNMPKEGNPLLSGANGPRVLEGVSSPRTTSRQVLAPSQTRYAANRSMDGVTMPVTCSSTQPSAAMVVIKTAVKGST